MILLSGICPMVYAATAVETIRVPQDYPTIQEAVNAAGAGDVIRVGKGEFRGASVNKPVTIIGEGADTRITSGVSVPRQLPDPGFPPFAFVGFLISFGGSGATISNFRIELTQAPVIPNPILAIGIHVRHVDDVTVIHNEVVGPGSAALPQYAGVYLLGASQCAVALNKMDGTYNGVALSSDPFINTPTSNNQVVNNRMFNMRIGIDIREHLMNPAIGFGPEQPIQQNTFYGNSMQGEIGLNLFDQSGTLRDFIRDNNFIRNDFRQCTTPLQENVPGLANKNHFFVNPGL
jgi:nitrous oxidase accessory protein NosD